MQRRWLFGIVMIILGALTIIPDGDATFFLFTLLLGGISMFVSDEED